MTYTQTVLFAGAGGDAQGAAVVPGVELVVAANHWPQAVETHAENFPHVDHRCADISQTDPRLFPSTDLAWMSPSCTHHSGARGDKQRERDRQPDLFGEALPDEAAERSRATMWDVVRFAEHHRYEIIMVENVVEVAKWVLWPAWQAALRALGYRFKVLYLNSMHVAGGISPRAPQSRDRVYVVAWREGNPGPDLEIRPLAWCFTCDEQVEAMQVWKRHDREPWGKYGRTAQYLYRCPRSTCRHAPVEPYVLPAAAAIDWTLPGERIGDRARPLSEKTIARIRAGLARYAQPLTFEHCDNTLVRTGADGQPVYARVWPVDQPTATLTTSEKRALVVPSGGTWNEDARPVSDPLRARTTCEMDALVVPYYGTGVARSADREMPTMCTVDTAGVAFIAELRGGYSTARDVRDPLATVTAGGNNHMLVRHNSSRGAGGEMCTPVDEPARTLTTTGHQSVVGWPHEVPDVDDCTFRMLDIHEIQAAMAFEGGYRVLGNRRARVRQLGGAVTPPVSELLHRRAVESLERSA